MDNSTINGTIIEHIHCLENYTTPDIFKNNYLFYMIFFLSAYIIRVMYNFFGLQNIFPESASFIGMGIILAWSAKSLGVTSECLVRNNLRLTHFFFFYILLPPIILDASYGMCNSLFLSNVPTVMIFAILGTFINFIFIGSIINLLNYVQAFGPRQHLDIRYSLFFASIIVAVDPVAVIQLFEEIHADAHLYFLVSGEALLNDAMTVALFKTCNRLRITEISDFAVMDLVQYVVEFVIATVFSSVVGTACGLCCAIFVKKLKLLYAVESVVMICMAYNAYLFAELLKMSGIISLITCGIVLSAYAKANLSDTSRTIFVNLVHVCANTSEIIIFVAMGVEFVHLTGHEGSKHSYYSILFVVATLILCLVGRTLTTVVLSAIVNKRRKKPITGGDQIMMIYSGLRGAVALSLILTSELGAEKDEASSALYPEMVYCTMIIVLFMNVVMGPYAKAVVTLCGIKLQKYPMNAQPITMDLSQSLIAQITPGVRYLSGDSRIGMVFRQFEKLILAPIFLSYPELRNPVMNSYLRYMYNKSLQLDSQHLFKMKLEERRLPEISDTESEDSDMHSVDSFVQH